MSAKMVQLGQGRKQRNAASSVRTSGAGVPGERMVSI